MINFLKSYTLENFKVKMTLLYILNLTDTIFTQFVLFKAPALFKESNPILQAIVTDYPVVLIKIFLPPILFFMWYKRIKISNNKELKSSRNTLLVLITVYSVVNVMHIINMGIYIYMCTKYFNILFETIVI